MHIYYTTYLYTRLTNVDTLTWLFYRTSAIRFFVCNNSNKPFEFGPLFMKSSDIQCVKAALGHEYKQYFITKSHRLTYHGNI